MSTSLLFSKARVAPLSTKSIPRLELVASHLLSKRLPYIAKLLKIENSQAFAWTDSSIVLCWLQKSPSSLNTFVSHRISFIQQAVPSSQWRHVSSLHNPADLLSRGTSASSLIPSSLWWHGPPWLHLPPTEWPKPQFTPPNTLPETKVVVMMAPSSPPDNPLWKYYSSFNHLVRVVAWIRRFIHNVQGSKFSKVFTSSLSTDEIQTSKKSI